MAKGEAMCVHVCVCVGCAEKKMSGGVGIIR